jgi:hypothetical protein
MNGVEVELVKRVVSFGIACAVALVGLGGGGVAQAAPPDGGDQASCVYTLSRPFVVDVSGRQMVSATLDGLPCTGSILPNSKTVCVQLQGNDGPPLCKYLPGYGIAQVYFAPYRPGSTYVSSGTGCGSVRPTLVSVCATQGPFSATL